MIGMQLKDEANLRTVDPHQFAVALSCGIYAGAQLQFQGKITDFPNMNSEADFIAFGQYMARRYQESMTDVAVGMVNELTTKISPDELREGMTTAAEDMQSVFDEIVNTAADAAEEGFSPKSSPKKTEGR